MSTGTDLQVAWARLLQDVELARNYPAAYSLDTGLAARNPLVDELLPSFAFLRLVSVLDEGLEDQLQQLGKPRKGTLHEHIAALEACGALSPQQANDLRGLKGWRNGLAHEAQPRYLDWALLDKALGIVDGILQQFGLVGTRPAYTVVAERGKVEESAEPDVLCVQPYAVRVEENGRPVLSIHWTTKTYRDGAGE